MLFRSCFTFSFAFCSCLGTDIPDEAREIYRGTLILEQSALPYQLFWVTGCKKGCLSSSSLSRSLADRRWGRAGSLPSPPDTAPSPAKHAATSLGCCSMSSSNCCFLTYIQISQEAGQMVWHRWESDVIDVKCAGSALGVGRPP